jgi:hypothetical protein
MKTSVVALLVILVLSISTYTLLGEEGLVTENRFVTLINTKYEAGYINLSFEPLEDSSLRYRVYRSEKPIISQSDVESATLIASIDATDIPLRDYPGMDGKFYYAVTVVEEFPELIPYLNTTTSPIDFSPIPEVIDTFSISSFDMEDGTHLLNIQFIPTSVDHAYNLYTDNTPITDIVDASPAASVAGTKGYFELTLEEDSPLFMAITILNRLGIENRTLIPGRNVTTGPFVIASGEGETLVRKPDIAPVTQPTTVIDEQEQGEKEPSALDLIQQNLRNHFYRGDYETALNNFDSILKRGDLSGEERGFTALYAGQCSFYLEDYEKAVKYFVQSKETESYEGMADAWIERSLDHVQ